MNTNNLNDILALMEKSVEELATDAGMTVEEAHVEVVRVEKKLQVSDVISTNPKLFADQKFAELISEIRTYWWTPEVKDMISEIEKTWNINLATISWWVTLLMFAGHNWFVELVKKLLSYWADKDLPNKKWLKAQDYVAKLLKTLKFKKNQDNFKERLLKIHTLLGADDKKTPSLEKDSWSSPFLSNTDAVDLAGIKELFSYLEANSMVEWKNLIGLKMDPDAKMFAEHENYPLYTLLMAAVCKWDLTLIRMLILLWSNPNLKNPKGKTSFQLAKLLQEADKILSENVYELLKKSPLYSPKKDLEKILDYLDSKTMSGWVDVIRWNDYDIEIPDSDWRRLLFMAIEVQDLKLLQMVLDYWVEVNHVMFKWKTPYLFAKKLQKDYHGTEEWYWIIAEMIKATPWFNWNWNLEVYTWN